MLADKTAWLRRNAGYLATAVLCLIADLLLWSLTKTGIMPLLCLDALLVVMCFWLESSRKDDLLAATLIHMGIFVLGAAGFVWYLAGSIFMPFTLPVLVGSCIYIAAYYMLWLAIYCVTSSGKASRWRLYAQRVFIAWFLLLPLLGYISFDLQKMLIVANILEMTPWKFVSDYNISRCLIGFLVKSLLGAAGVFMALMPLEPCRFAGSIRKKFGIIIPALLVILTVLTLTDNPVCKLMRYESPLDKAMKTRQNPLFATSDYQVEDKSTPGMYFLIVGESYDYDRAENLRQYKTFYDRIHSQKDYIVFNNTYSVPLLANNSEIVGGSQYAIVNMLHNSSEPQPQEYLLDNPHLFDVMKFCKVKTLTLSNYGPNRIYANVQRHITETADHVMTTDYDSFGGKYSRLGFQIDGEIPNTLQEWYDKDIFNKQKSFMFIQVLGTHFDDMPLPRDYKEKYQSWGVTDDKEGRNFGYLYFDVMLEKMIQKMQSFPETRAIIFCSDHSWNRGGDDDKIVMFIWLSETLKKERPDLQHKLQEMADKKFNNVQMYDLILEIMNISVKKK